MGSTIVARRMSFCPWCEASRPAPFSVCPECGRRAADGRRAAAAGEETLSAHTGGAPKSEIPELQLEPVPSRGALSGAAATGARLAPPSASPASPSSRGGGAQELDAGWDDPDEDEPAAALEMATVAPVAPRPMRPALQALASGQASRTAPEGGALQGVATAPPISAESVSGDAVDFDPYEIKALAGFGADPKSLPGTLPYAIRVKLRQRQLRRGLADVRRSLSDAEARRDDRLVELGELLRPHIAHHSELSAFAPPLVAAERVKQSRETAVEDANATFRERVGAIDKQIAALAEPLALAKSVEEARSEEHAKAEALRARHEARRKRVEIDVRQAQTKLERADVVAEERAKAQALITAAAQEKNIRAAEEQIARSQAEDALARAAASRRALAEVQGRVEALQRQRTEAESEFERQRAVRREGIDAATREMRIVFREIGRRAATSGPVVPGVEAKRRAIDDAAAHVARLQRDLEMHLRAIDSADRSSVRRGLVILGVLLAMLLGAFAAWRILRANPYIQEHDRAPNPMGAPR